MHNKKLALLTFILFIIVVIFNYFQSITSNITYLSDYVHMCALSLFAAFNFVDKDSKKGLMIGSFVYLIYTLQSATLVGIPKLLGGILLFIMFFMHNKGNDKLLSKLWYLPGALLLISLILTNIFYPETFSIINLLNYLEPIALSAMNYNVLEKD